MVTEQRDIFDTGEGLEGGVAQWKVLDGVRNSG